MKTFPTPDFLREGSLWDHMMRMGFPLITSKFMVSRARSAAREAKDRFLELVKKINVSMGCGILFTGFYSAHGGIWGIIRGDE